MYQEGFSLAFDMAVRGDLDCYLVGALVDGALQMPGQRPEACPGAGSKRHHGAARRAHAAGAVRAGMCLAAHHQPGRRDVPQALVTSAATPGRQMFTTYGPTEATVSASLAELHAGEPVTIGEALPNYGLLVIEVIEPEAIVDGRLSP